MYGGVQNRFTHRMMRMGGCSTVCACQPRPAWRIITRSGGAEPLFGETSASGRRISIPLPGICSAMCFPVSAHAQHQAVRAGFGKIRRIEGCSCGVPFLQGDASYAEAEAFVRVNIDAGYTVQYLLLRHKAEEFLRARVALVYADGLTSSAPAIWKLYTPPLESALRRSQRPLGYGQPEKGGMDCRRLRRKNTCKAA
jgi:hypothetical protein